MSAGQAVGFPQDGEAFPIFEGNGRNEAAIRTVVEPNCVLKAIWPKGIAVVLCRNKPLIRHAAIVLAAVAAFALPAEAAYAAGLFDFLFGGFHDQPTPSPAARPYAEPMAPIAPPPLGSESVRGGGGSGHAVAYCVRLCDGQHFPMEHITNATPVETCRAMCPASKTKVYFGSEIGGAMTRDGARYADLDNAFLYRKQLVANCTCNGKDAFGLAPFDLSSDPTLRPGDIVATKDGLLAYTGKTARGDGFVPVKPSSAGAQLNAASRKQPTRRDEPAIDDDPGTIAMPQRTSAPVNGGAETPGQSFR
jgi:hypothetical protein